MRTPLARDLAAALHERGAGEAQGSCGLPAPPPKTSGQSLGPLHCERPFRHSPTTTHARATVAVTLSRGPLWRHHDVIVWWP